MRFTARIISMLMLCIAVIAGVVDVIQSVAAGTIILQPLGEAWAASAPDSLALVSDTLKTHIHPVVEDPVFAFVLAQPAVVVFLVLALLFHMAGFRYRKPAGRFAA